MRCGLYGKLPSKRDFISIAAPRTFLQVWEPWIAECMTQSRAALGESDWRRAFEEAPIWRFYLSAELYRDGLFGAFTPSMDAIGRYFPLTFLAQDGGETFARPESDACQNWFDAVEDFLLSLVEGDPSRDMIDSGLANLGGLILQPQLQGTSSEASAIDFSLLCDTQAATRSLEEIFAAGRRREDAAAVNYWWTLGNEVYRPRALVQRSMPDPLHFTAMLTEQLARPSQETSHLG